MRFDLACSRQAGTKLLLAAFLALALPATGAWATAASDRSQIEDPVSTIRGCTQMIEKDPTNVTAYFNRGIAYLTRRLTDLAIADFAKIIELDPDYADGYAYRGLAYEQKGDKKNAIADYRKALAIDPSNAAPQEGLARLGA